MNTNIGKKINSTIWIHVSARDSLSPELHSLTARAVELSGLSPELDFNIIKIDDKRNLVTLLDYPDFFDIGFPTLKRYWTINIHIEEIRFRTYEDSLNPPILHRKELMLPESDPRRASYADLTSSADQIGLFDDPKRIGFKRSWEELLNRRGYMSSGNSLLRIGNEEGQGLDEDSHFSSESIARHRTALVRYTLSAPMQTLDRFGYLDGRKTIFDYGCGQGDDVRALCDNGIQASGWDPYHAPDNDKHTANIVNLGFVINVIEDIDERIDALVSAYQLADELLIVSAMLASQDATKGTPYGDGVITSRNTFQKYYTQSELNQFIIEVLDANPIPVSPGIFYVFKNKDKEQKYLYGRQANRRNILRLAGLSRAKSPMRAARAEEKYQQNRLLLERLWRLCISLGRTPQRDEVPHLDEINDIFGSLPAAIGFIKSRKDEPDTTLSSARESRINDLLVYFALLQFVKKTPYSHLEPKLRIDIKEFFGNYSSALKEGNNLLFSISDTNTISDACIWSEEHGIGYLDDDGSLQLHTSMVEQLPPVLRVYIGCSTYMYGDISSADLIKVHSTSGKLTLINFDDFENNAIPRMTTRIKINFRSQSFDVFDYVGEYVPPYLYNKSRFINEEYPHYAEQIAFEESLDSLNLFEFIGYGPTPDEFDTQLSSRRYKVAGLKLIRNTDFPDIDSPCGKYFTYRDLIECGETQAKTGISNLPKEPNSYTALHDLATLILDPIIDYFGMIKLTHGFSSNELIKKILGSIAPKLDQHAAHERKRLGNHICPRLGAAVDFIVEYEDMHEVAKWIYENIPFDRMYFYGCDKSLHISYGPDDSRYVARIVKNGSKIPFPKPMEFTD